MAEPVNWIDRLDSAMGWGRRHPFLARVAAGLVTVAVAVAALASQIRTTGHE